MSFLPICAGEWILKENQGREKLHSLWPFSSLPNPKFLGKEMRMPHKTKEFLHKQKYRKRKDVQQKQGNEDQGR